MNAALLLAGGVLGFSQQAAPASVPAPEAQLAWGRFFRVVSRDGYRPPSGAERWRLYLGAAYGSPGPYLRAAFPAASDHLDNSPAEWGQGAQGYSRRLANCFARYAIQDSIAHASSAVLGYEVRYVKCGRAGFWPRFGHALAWRFLTLDRQGRTTVNLPGIGSVFAAEFTGNTWMPAGYRTTREALGRAGLQLGTGALINLVREFAPRRRGG